MLLGFYGHGPLTGVTTWAREFPETIKLLTRHMRLDDPQFKFTSIQVNNNYVAQAHTDRDNHGDSFIVAPGSYTGGQLWAQHLDGTELHAITPDESKHLGGLSRPGHLVPGISVDIHESFHMFDGTLLHMAKEFTGDRVSMVWLTPKNYVHVATDDCDFLQHLGFNLPLLDHCLGMTIS